MSLFLEFFFYWIVQWFTFQLCLCDRLTGKVMVWRLAIAVGNSGDEVERVTEAWTGSARPERFKDVSLRQYDTAGAYNHQPKHAGLVPCLLTWLKCFTSLAAIVDILTAQNLKLCSGCTSWIPQWNFCLINLLLSGTSISQTGVIRHSRKGRH